MLWLTAHLGTFFVENVGQRDKDVLFYTLNGVDILKDGRVRLGDVVVRFGGKPTLVSGTIEGKVAYFGKGKALKSYAFKRVVLKDVRPYLDVILTFDERGRLEMQFLLRPGGDPDSLYVSVVGGVPELRDGALYVSKGGRTVLKLSDLHAFQGAEEVEVVPVVLGTLVLFRVPDYDPEFPLVLDPIVTTLLTSSGEDLALDVVMDGDGNVLVAGSTSYPDNFASPRTFFGISGESDAFVSKLAGDLGSHIATAIIASPDVDIARRVVVDNEGNVLVLGYTYDPYDFAPERRIFGTPGGMDIFITKLSGDLTTHLSTAILASTGIDYVGDLVVDGDGNVIVVGQTDSSQNFSSFRLVWGETNTDDAFVSKLSGNLDTVLTTVIMASVDEDGAIAVTLARDGDILVAGYTDSCENFAIGPKYVFGTLGSDGDAFVSRISPDLMTLRATAIVASSDWDAALDVMEDREGNILIAGATRNSSDFAPSRTIIGTSNGYDAFVTKLSGDLNTHIATAILAADFGGDFASSLSLDGTGNVLVAGITENSSTFSSDREIYGLTGNEDVFLVRLSNDLSRAMRTLIFASPYDDECISLTTEPDGDVLLAGLTSDSYNFSVNRTFFGSPSTPTDTGAFVILIPLSLSTDEVSPSLSSVSVDGRRITFTLSSPAYVGYDLYSEDGRLIDRVSFGYLPAGRYVGHLEHPKGTYMLRVRVGGHLEDLKVILR